jgi:hypothetical protein
MAFALILLGAASRSVLRSRRTPEVTARAWRHALLWTASGVLLAVPPIVRWYDARIRLAHAWLYEHLASIRVVRVPMRLGVVALVGASLLAGLAFAELTTRLRGDRQSGRAWRSVGLVLLALTTSAAFLAQAWSGIGYPPGFVAPHRPPLYPVAARPRATPFAEILEGGRSPILELGAAVFCVPYLRPSYEGLTMFRSIGHWRPLLNGYSSYWPATYPRVMALAARLPEDMSALVTLRRETGVDLILVWPEELPPAKRDAWRARADSPDSIPLRLVARDDQALLFEVSPALPGLTGRLQEPPNFADSHV